VVATQQECTVFKYILIIWGAREAELNRRKHTEQLVPGKHIGSAAVGVTPDDRGHIC
jgi:hypothetical protein